MTHPSQDGFLRGAALSALQGAIVVGLLPILPEVVGNLMTDTATTNSFPVALWAIVTKHQDLIFEIALTGALAGTFLFLYRHRSFPTIPTIDPPLTRERLATLAGSWHLPGSKTRLPKPSPSILPTTTQCDTICAMFRELGVLTAENRPVSDLADAFLCSLTASLREPGLNVICPWPAPPQTSEHDAARALMREIEGTRIRGRPLSLVPAARHVRSGLAVIRMDVRGEPRFLMISSTRWGTPAGWWFVGGTEEPQDEGDLASTVRREVNEELGGSLDNDAVLDCCPIGPPTTDKRISEGHGVLTDYHFQLFAVRLKSEHPKVRNLLTARPPTVDIPMRDAVRIHTFNWLSWSEVLQEPHLLRHSPYLLDDLKRHVSDPHQLPTTWVIA